MTVDLKTYNRSTHDLSYAWRSSMGVGTLVPCMKILGLPGDTFDIRIDNKVLTHPTVGPLFGSYKLQVDIFTVPFRLYIAALHNNALNVGMDMSKVKIPIYRVGQKQGTDLPKDLLYSSSCILTYLGNRGQQTRKSTGSSLTVQDFNAVPILGYLDIFKNYYANKQEEYFKFIGADPYIIIDSSSLKINAISTDVGSQRVTGGTINIILMNGPAFFEEVNKDDIEITFTQKIGTDTEFQTVERTYTLTELAKWFASTPVQSVLT